MAMRRHCAPCFFAVHGAGASTAAATHPRQRRRPAFLRCHRYRTPLKFGQHRRRTAGLTDARKSDAINGRQIYADLDSR